MDTGEHGGTKHALTAGAGATEFPTAVAERPPISGVTAPNNNYGCHSGACSPPSSWRALYVQSFYIATTDQKYQIGVQRFYTALRAT